LQGRWLTVCVSGGGAGVDKTPGAGFRSGVDKARKCRRIPTVHCTLCWHAFDLQDSLPEKILPLMSRQARQPTAEIIARTFQFGNYQKP